MLAPTVTQHKVTDDYRIGQKMYWQGYSDSRCANVAQKQGWFDACAEDDRGRAAYLHAMALAERDGERVDWRDVYDIAGVTYNAYGDVVR